MSEPDRPPPRWAILALTLVAFALRAFHMNAQNLWYDEIGTVNVVATPLPALAPALETGRVEPTAWLSTAYYALAKSVAAIAPGDRDAALRCMSVLLGTATIPALAWATAPIVPTGTVVALSTALAISPFHVWYSQEVRPYALLVLLVTLAMGAYVRALADGGSRRWALTSVLLALALYTHPIALALLAVCGLGLLAEARADWRRCVPGFIALAAAAVAFVPAIVLIRAYGANNAADVRGVGWLDLPYAFYAYSVGFSWGPSTTELHFDRLPAVLGAWPAILVAVIVFGTLAVRGVHALGRLAPNARLVVAAWLVAPLALAFGMAVLTANPFNVRYGIVSFPAFVVLLGLGATDVRRPAVAGLAIGAVLISLLSLTQLASEPRYAKEDCRGLGAALATAAAPDDLIIVNASYMALAVSYYYPGPATVVPYPPIDIDDDLDPATTATDVGALSAGRRHVWLVSTRTFHGDHVGTLARVLGDQRVADRTLRVPGIVATRYSERAER